MFSGRANASGRKYAKYKQNRAMILENEAIVGINCTESMMPDPNCELANNDGEMLDFAGRRS